MPQIDLAQQNHDSLATALGWASIGLGVPLTTAPGQTLDAIGVEEDDTTRAIALAVGAQEYTAAAGILALERPRPVVSLWSRVAGDITHLALLGAAWNSKRTDGRRLAGAMAFVAGCAVLDTIAAVRFSRDQTRTTKGSTMHLKASVTIKADRREVYDAWRDFENFPAFMFHLESVEDRGGGRSHWKAKGPLKSVEWDAEIAEDRPGEMIAWRSVEDADLANSGVVGFADAPGDRGTEVICDMTYQLPGGKLGEAVAKLFGEEPHQQVKDDLRRFKQLIETGEVVRSEGSPEGQAARRHLKQRPAQPPPGEGERAATFRASIGGQKV